MADFQTRLGRYWITNDKVDDFSIKEQLLDNNFYNVIPGEGSATIIDYDESIKDEINIFNENEEEGIDPSNTTFDIYLGDTEIKTISNDSNYAISDKTLSIQLTNPLYLFDTIQYKGFDYSTNVKVIDIIKNIESTLGVNIDLSNNSYFAYNGKNLSFYEYFSNLIMPIFYLPQSSGREVLQKLCKLGQMSLVYINTVDNIYNLKAISCRLSVIDSSNPIVINNSVLTEEFNKSIILKNAYNIVKIPYCYATTNEGSESFSYEPSITNVNSLSFEDEETGPDTVAKNILTVDFVASSSFEANGFFNKFPIKIPKKMYSSTTTITEVPLEEISYNLFYSKKEYTYYYEKEYARMTEDELNWYENKDLSNIANNEWTEINVEKNYTLYNGNIGDEGNDIELKGNLKDGLSIFSRVISFSSDNDVLRYTTIEYDTKTTITQDDNYFYLGIAIPVGFNNQTLKKHIDKGYFAGAPAKMRIIEAKKTILTPYKLVLSINGKTYEVNLDHKEKSYYDPNKNTVNNEVDLYGENEFFQEKVIFFDKVVDIPQTVAYNIIEDYKNGRSTATAHIVCADLYDTDGFLAKDFERKGEILDLGDIVYVQEDDTKWLVTGREVHYDGTPTMDVELVQVGKIINTDISQDPTLREGDYLQFPYVNEYWNSTYAPKGVADTEYATISWDYETNSSAYATVEYKYVFDRDGDNLIETMPISPSKLTYNVGKILSFDDNLFKIYSPILAVPETKVTASTKVDLFWSLVENKKLVEVDFENGSKISAVNTSSPIVVGDETYLNDEFSIYYKESVEKALLSETTYGETLGNIKLVPNFTAIGAGATGYLSFVTNGTVVEFGSQTGIANFYMSFGATDIVYSSTIMGAVEKLTYYCYVSGFVDGKDNEISFSPDETWYDSRIPLDSFRISNYQPTETYEQSREDTYGSYKYTLTGNDLKIEINIYQGILKDLMTDPMIQVIVSPIETFVRLYDNDNSPTYYYEGEIIEIANAERGDFSFNTTSTFYPTLDSCFEFFKTTPAKLPTSGAKIVYDGGIEVVCASSDGTPTLVFADTNTSSTFGNYTFNQTLNTEQIFLATRDFGKVVSVEGNWGDFKLYKKQIYLYDNLTGATTYFNQKQTNFLLGFTSKIIKTRKVDLALMGVETDQSFQQGETLYIDRSQIVTEGSYDQVIFTNGNSLGLCYATEDNTIGGSPGQGLWWYDGTLTPYNIIIFKGKGFETVSLPNAQNGWGNILSANKNTGIYVSSNLVEDIEVSGGFSLSKSDKITPDYKGWFTIKKSY